jgi:hypothetical protein
MRARSRHFGSAPPRQARGTPADAQAVQEKGGAMRISAAAADRY